MPGLRVHAYRWDGETVLFLDGARETMVVTELGAAAIGAVWNGCSDLATLEDWCRRQGFAEAGEELAVGLATLIGKLADLEVIELVA